MAATSIEWTDSVWNPTVGCSVLSPGCTNCYAMKMAARLENMGGSAGHHYRNLTQTTKAGPVWNGTVRLVESALVKPLSWKKPRRIFVNSMSDLFHEALTDEAIDRVFAVMALAPRHTFQVLTKRADRMRAYMEGLSRGPERLEAVARTLGYTLRFEGHSLLPWPLPQVWLGVSVEDQARADERIPALLATPAAVRFLSAEPLLGPLDLARFLWRVAAPSEMPGHALNDAPGADYLTTIGKLGWVIAGSESGHGARECDIDWVRGLRDQCSAAGTAFFWKQDAERGKKIPTPELDGRRWMEFPA